MSKKGGCMSTFKSIFKNKNPKYLPEVGNKIKIKSSQFPMEPIQTHTVTKIEFPIIYVDEDINNFFGSSFIVGEDFTIVEILK